MQIKQQLSNKKIVGFFDADGSIRIEVTNYSKYSPNSIVIYGFTILFSFTQAEHNLPMLKAVKFTSGGVINHRTRDNKNEYVLNNRWSSQTGKALVGTLKRFLPIVPNKRKDFLITLEIQKLLDRPRTKENTAAILHLTYKLSSESNTNSTVIKRQVSLSDRLKELKASPGELKTAKALANSIFSKIDAYMQAYIKRLEKRKLPKDYLLGFFWGDGGLTVDYQKASSNIGTRAMVPVLTMAEPSRPFLNAIKNSFENKGGIRPVGSIQGNCLQYRLTGWETFRSLVLPFLTCCWHPPYFQTRINKMVTFTKMQARKAHMTVKGWSYLVEESYGMCHTSETSTHRVLEKETILLANIDYIENRRSAAETAKSQDPLKKALKEKHWRKLKKKN